MSNSNPCKIEGCDRRAKTRGWCQMHYMRWYTHGDPGPPGPLRQSRTGACKVEGCEREIQARRYCNMHLIRVDKSGEAGPAEPLAELHKPSPWCKIDGCSRERWARDLCGMHLYRLKHHGDVGPAESYRPGGSRIPMSTGYIRVHVPDHPNANSDGYVLEHRLVMEADIGRILRPDENGHHLNGVRDDNRPENLELWVKPQPSGQRVEDLVRWVVGEYEPYVRAALEDVDQLQI